MIKSELEYQVSLEWVEKFKKSIVAMEKDEAAKINAPSAMGTKPRAHYNLLRNKLKAEIALIRKSRIPR